MNPLLAGEFLVSGVKVPSPLVSSSSLILNVYSVSESIAHVVTFQFGENHMPADFIPTPNSERPLASSGGTPAVNAR